MDNIINLKEVKRHSNKKKFQSAELICKDAFKSLLHQMNMDGFPIDDEEFQKDLAIAFKFIHAAVSRKYGLESPFIEAIDEFKKKHEIV